MAFQLDKPKQRHLSTVISALHAVHSTSKQKGWRERAFALAQCECARGCADEGRAAMPGT